MRLAFVCFFFLTFVNVICVTADDEATLVALIERLDQTPADATSFRVQLLDAIGLTLHGMQRHEDALEAYDVALALDPHNVNVMFNAAVAMERLGRVVDSGLMYNRLLAADPFESRGRLNVAALHHTYGRLVDAVLQYELIVNQTEVPVPTDIRFMALTNLAQAYIDLGRTTEAIQYMTDATSLTAKPGFRYTVVEFTLRAHRVVGDWSGYHVLVDELLHGVRQALAAGTVCPLLPFDTMLLPVPIDLRYAVAVAHSKAYERVVGLLRARHTAPQHTRLPFPMPPLFPLTGWPVVSSGGVAAVAAVAASTSLTPVPTLPTPRFDVMHLPSDRRYAAPGRGPAGGWTAGSPGRLSVGYFTCDYTNHPTAHMAEGLFQHHDRHRVAVSALSFGKDDGSDYRARIMAASDAFLNLVTMGYGEGADAVSAAGVHILMDMQSHTRGARQKLVAQRPAPIQVNFLVYPGTTGSAFVDYLVADRFVTPPEQQRHYSERLVLMPNSYQVNYYTKQSVHRTDGHHRAATADPRLGAVRVGGDAFLGVGDDGAITANALPAGAGSTRAELRAQDPDDRSELGLGTGFVFANFNKNEKLEPRAYAVWMSILRRVPGSVLWVLTPQQSGARLEQTRRLLAEAARHGVDPNRVVFAARCEKDIHLARHRHVDLFLDTFVYGAHSTATDALRGGAPVLTCPGEAFPSRVATSLLENTDMNWLVTHTMKEYEDLAVRLAQSPTLLRAIRTRHAAALTDSHRRRLPLFDTPTFVADLERSFQMMWDVYVALTAHLYPASSAGEADVPLSNTHYATVRRHLIVAPP